MSKGKMLLDTVRDFMDAAAHADSNDARRDHVQLHPTEKQVSGKRGFSIPWRGLLAGLAFLVLAGLLFLLLWRAMQ